LEGKKAAPYALFDKQVRPDQLVTDLAKLSGLGPISGEVRFRVVDPQPAMDFVKRHGLLWHRPQEGSDSCRESLRSWLFEGHEMFITIKLYVELRKAITTRSTEGLKSCLRGLRDVRGRWGDTLLWGSMPREDEQLLEESSILLAERITKGLEGCAPTMVAACSLPRTDGEKEGPVGDFRSSINPSNLVAVAYYTLSTLIESKAWFKECAGCGELFRLNPKIHHRDRTYCDDDCYDRTRKRRQRKKKRKPA
jgi:hypothetical protein